MENKKRLAINMIAQIVSFVTNFIISFLLTPFIVKYIGKEANGFVGLANNFISYATIVTTALNSMAGRFITISVHKKEYEDVKKYYSSVFFANVFISIPLTILATFILLYLNRIVQVPNQILIDVTILWALLFINFILSLIGSVCYVATFTYNRLDLSSRHNIESNILRVIILVIAFYFFEPSVWYIGLASLLCGSYNLIVNIIHTKRLLPYVKIDKKYFDFKKVKQLVSSGIWNSVSSLSSTLNTGLDLLITNLYIGASNMGLVSIAKIMPTYVLSTFSMLSSVFTPSLTINYATNNRDELKRELFFSVKLLAFIACIPMGFMYVFSKEFYELWIPGQNAELLMWLTIFSCLTLPISLPLEPLWSAFTITNNVKKSSVFVLVSSVISIITTIILLNMVTNDTIKMFIIVGTSSIIGIIRSLFFLPIYGAKCFDFKWNTFYPIIFKNIVSILCIIIFGNIIKIIINPNGWISFFLSVCIMICFAIVFNYFWILKKNEREIITHKVRSVLKI